MSTCMTCTVVLPEYKNPVVLSELYSPSPAERTKYFEVLNIETVALLVVVSTVRYYLRFVWAFRVRGGHSQY